MEDDEKRKAGTPIKVYCLPEEKKEINRTASDCGLSCSAYMRKLGLAYEPASIIDNKQTQELLKVNADLGRLGGLLKLWLSDDKKAAGYKRSDIINTLDQIRTTQDEIRNIVKHIVKV